MGKPYASELERLDETFAWAQAFDISLLRQAIGTASTLPLLAIGSGGSLTAAHMLAGFHRRYAKKLATSATPLEGISMPLSGDISVWLLSAAGKNPDILTSFFKLAHREPRQLSVFCGSLDSPLAQEVRSYRYVDLVEFSVPAGRDGFLATNSLLASTLLIARGYAEENAIPWLSTGTLDQIFSDSLSSNHNLETLRVECDILWKCDTIVVLYGPLSQTGAVDLESKFTEAALGGIQTADYRNFAHGRHHWLARRGGNSGVLAFTSPSDRTLADRTLALIPPHIPVVRIDLSGDTIEIPVASVLLALHITQWAGLAQGIDPGRPGVPAFGRRLYNLRIPQEQTRGRQRVADEIEKIAIERKVGLPVDKLKEREDFLTWQSAYRQFRRKLSGTLFSAIVFDYDGTLVDTRNRFDYPNQDIVKELMRLLENNLIIGIATGRGSSVRRSLQTCMPPGLWSRILIGSYNGADIRPLDDNHIPDGKEQLCEQLIPIANTLKKNRELAAIAIQKNRRHQISLLPCRSIPENRLWDIAQQTVQSTENSDVSVVRSSHSVDILAPGVSKTALLDKIRSMSIRKEDNAILTIGDRGRWPGNDFELLGSAYSLSVDETSVDPLTCWNLALPGHRGVQATLSYCRSLRIDRDTSRARLEL